MRATQTHNVQTLRAEQRRLLDCGYHEVVKRGASALTPSLSLLLPLVLSLLSFGHDLLLSKVVDTHAGKRR